MDEHFRQVKIELGPKFPTQVEGLTLVIADLQDPNKHKVELTTYDTVQIKQFENLFKLYGDWLAKHTQQIGPDFRKIADEVKDWLSRKYNINPVEGGFIDWYLYTKLKNGVMIHVHENSNKILSVEVEFGMLNNRITPTVIEQDLHEYCQWRLKRHEQAALSLSSLSNSVPIKSPLNNKTDFRFNFEAYIDEQFRAKWMPFLKQNYTNAKPEQYGYMIYALTGLRYASESIFSNKTALHQALETSFGKVGTRQSLNTAVNRLSPRAMTDEDKRMIEVTQQRIKEFMQSDKPN